MPHFVEAHMGEGLRETHASLLAVPVPKGFDERLLDELTRQVIQLRKQVLSESLNQVRYLQDFLPCGCSPIHLRITQKYLPTLPSLYPRAFHSLLTQPFSKTLKKLDFLLIAMLSQQQSPY